MIQRGVRYLVTRMNIDDPSKRERDENASPAATDVGADVEENTQTIDRSLDKASGYTRYATQTLRKFLIIPLQLGFIGVTIIALIPLVLCWYWTR